MNFVSYQFIVLTPWGVCTSPDGELDTGLSYTESHLFSDPEAAHGVAQRLNERCCHFNARVRVVRVERAVRAEKKPPPNYVVRVSPGRYVLRIPARPPAPPAPSGFPCTARMFVDREHASAMPFRLAVKECSLFNGAKVEPYSDQDSDHDAVVTLL